MVLREWPVTRAVEEMLTPATRRLATWSNSRRVQRSPRYAVPVFVLSVLLQMVQRYRHRRVLAPFAVDQAAVRCSYGHENVGSSVVPGSLRWPITGMRTTATRRRRERPRAVEDVAPGQSRADQTGLYRWRPGLAPELQCPVRPYEIVMTAHEFNVPAERRFASGMARRSPAQVRGALTNGEVEALDERRVQGLGILRLPQRSPQSRRGCRSSRGARPGRPDCSAAS